MGAFPAEFQAKYNALIEKYNAFTIQAVKFFDGLLGGGSAFTFFSDHERQGRELDQERDKLKEEAVKLGISDPSLQKSKARVF
jgi:hypothetical protein